MSAPGSIRRVSTRDDYETPDEVYDPLNEEFGFTIDVCADEDNHKCERWYGIGEDGLSYDWQGICWMNPPYSDIKRWVAHASQQKCTVVALLPNNTDTKWFHEIVWPTASEIRFLPRRISFLKDGIPQKDNTGGSIVVVWRIQDFFPLKVTTWDYR